MSIMLKFFDKIYPYLSLQKGKIAIAAISLLLLIIAQPASAHHAFGNQTPTNFFEGFLSGLAHPIIGFDHFAFVVAIGLIAATLSNGIAIPIAFILSAMVGTGVHLIKLDLPFPEVAIALSVIAVGILLILRKSLKLEFLIALAEVAGLFHGYAYGEAIIGAKMAPLLSYLAGFSVIQFAIAFAAFKLAKSFHQTLETGKSSLLKYSGFVILAIGCVALTSALNQ